MSCQMEGSIQSSVFWLNNHYILGQLKQEFREGLVYGNDIIK